jgi:hypothetical protein
MSKFVYLVDKISLASLALLLVALPAATVGFFV